MNRRDVETKRMGKPAVIKGWRWMLAVLCLTAVAVLTACSTKPTDLRAMVPGDCLIYLETNDIAAALQPLVDSQAFTKAAKRKPDLSALKGVQLAVAITGFQGREEKLTDENSVAHIQPRFVAVADTHAWNFQAKRFAEDKLGAFVADVYGDSPAVEAVDKDGGRYFTWSAKDGRKAYALVVDSMIFFGNDASAIDKCLAARKGEIEALAKSGKDMPIAAGETLASGYVSSDGIAQIASVIGLKLASESSEESSVQRSIASSVPQVIRSWVKDVTWTARKTNVGIEDKFDLILDPDVAKVFAETMTPDETVQKALLRFAPSDAESVTQYNFKNPQLAWRTVVLAAQRSIDPSFAPLLPTFANAFFEPYGCRDGEMLLSSIEPGVVTVKGVEEDASAVVVKLRDKEKATKALDPEFVKTPGTVFDASGAGFDGVRVSGNPEEVLKCGQAERSGNNLSKDARFDNTPGGLPSIRTLTHDKETPGVVVDFLSERNPEAGTNTRSFTETRFTRRGIERKTMSDLGFIGWIIAQLAAE